SDLNSLNIEMLGAIGQRWDSLSSVEASHIDRLWQLGLGEKAARILEQKLSVHPIFAFKDPRVPKLFGFWQRVFEELGLDVSYLLVLRNPLSVAHSLAARDGFSREKSYALWLGHVVNSLLLTSGKPRTLVEFDIFMDDPERELRRMADELSFEVDEHELDVFVSGFLEENLRHTHFDAAALLSDPSCSPFVFEVYSNLATLGRTGSHPMEIPFEMVGTWHKTMAILEMTFKMADAIESRADVLSSEVSALCGQLAQREASAERLIHMLEVQKQMVSRLEHAISERESNIAELSGSVESLEGRLADIYSSTSWKMTAPFRALSTTLSKASGRKRLRSRF
ncbi:MAG: hypothetical protein M1305_00395, partial [Candidatus Marsarchaeota archaeon]|nr:hypothetical protein [Candidatus Marsarchaeota archaeon]